MLNATTGSTTSKPTKRTSKREKSAMSETELPITPSVIFITPFVSAYRVSCDVRAITLVRGCDNIRATKFEEIEAPRPLKKCKIRRVDSIEKTVLVIRAIAADIPKIAACS